MLDIYKELPGTNCGECGVPACIAFAVKVKNAQRKLSDCPYRKVKNGTVFSPKTPAAREDNYERVSNELEKEAICTDFQEAAFAIGGHYLVENGTGVIKFTMMNKQYEMRKEGLFEDNGTYCNDSWSKIIVYDYIRRKGNKSLTGDWVTLGHFPNTASHVKAFQRSAEEKVAIAFHDRIKDLKTRCKELGGREVPGRMKCDFICRFDLLPHIPFYVCFWESDEEFPASCKLFLDSSADAYIDIEYLAYLVERFIEIVVQKGYGTSGEKNTG